LFARGEQKISDSTDENETTTPMLQSAQHISSEA